MTMKSKPLNLDTLFEAHSIENVVLLVATSATTPQAHALVNMLSRTCALGEFRYSQSLDASNLKLTFIKATLERVNAFITSISMDQLSDEVAMIEKANAKYAAANAEAERVNKLSPRELGLLLCSRSAEKLLMVDMHDHTKLTLRTSLLIPVTHFKTLAKLTEYDWKTKTFTVREKRMDPSTRDKLLELADKLAKSTKKVTIEDIAARKASRKATYSHLTSSELEELIEDHMYDVFGYDSPENRKMSREAFGKK